MRSTYRNCLNRKEILNYLDGQDQFSRDELHEVEAHLLDCELCDTAIEGYRFLKEADYMLFKRKLSDDIEPGKFPIVEPVGDFNTTRVGLNGKSKYRDLSAGKNDDIDQDNPHEFHEIAAESSLEYNIEAKSEESESETDGDVGDLGNGNRRRWQFGLAASFLMMILAGIGIFSVYFQRIDVDDYFGQGEELVVRVRNSSDQVVAEGQQGFDKIDMAMDAFERGEFLRSGELFESEMASDNSNSALAFFAGLSFLNAGELVKAGIYLSRSVETDHVFIEEAHWHLARFYLEDGNSEAAWEALQYLRDSENKDLRMKAIRLLRRL